MTKAVEEQRAVRQAGQHVVERLVAELVLEGPSVGDVAVVDDHAANGRVVEQVLGDRFERSPRAVGVAGAELDCDFRAVCGRDVGEPAIDVRPIVRVDVGGHPAPDPVLRPAPEDPFDSRALIADEPVLAEDHDAVRRVLDQRSEALLAAPEVHQQQPFGRGLLLEPAVLARQARATRHRAPARSW